MSQPNSAVILSVGVFTIYLILVLTGLYAQYRVPSFEEGVEYSLLAWLFLATGAALALGHPGADALKDVIVKPIRTLNVRAVWALALFALAAYMIVARLVLDAFPNSGDELAYVLQAQTYAQGRLWADPPTLAEAFRQYRFLDMEGKWVSQYPPGWAMVLTPAVALGLPLWIVNPIIGSVTLVAIFFLARRFFVSSESAWIAVLLLGVSSFFVLNSSSFFSHNVTALYGIGFAFFGLLFVERQQAWHAVAAGACIGLIGITRTQNAVIFAAPFVVILAIAPERRIGLFWFALGGAPFLVALLGYNGAVTGDPLLAVQDWRGTEPIGQFGTRTILLTIRHLIRLYIWTSPVLAFGFLIAFVMALRQRRADFTDLIMPLTLAVFLFYGGTGGNQYGPRYYFEAWPFAILTIMKVIDPILFGSERSVRSAWISSALIVSLLFQISYFPVRFEREHRVVTERQDVYRQAESAGLDNALVIIASPVGTIRTMFPGDLVRNGLQVGEQNILYVRDLGRPNSEIRSLFPDRDVYVYLNGRLFAAPPP